MTCGSCGRESEFPLCWPCTSELRKVIMKLYDQIDELQVQVTRQSVGAPSVGSSGGHEQALPYDVGASNMADELRKVLTHWYIPKDTQEIVYVACMSAQIRTKWLALWH